MEELFKIIYVQEKINEAAETQEYYVIFKGGEWFGEGNFCGWYSQEYYTNVEVYGILDKNYNIVELYGKPQKINRLEICSYMWGGNKLAKTIEDIKNKRWS